MVEIFILVMNVLSALGVIILVLLQHGKGADMGAAFGSGSSGSLFGASGSANFLSRATGALAAVFFVTTLGLTYLSSHKVGGEGVMKKVIPTQLGPTPSLPSANDDVSKVKEIPK
ncbi:MAG: preprotein translocase subunit SecG [Nitrosospira sp.]|nr:preprotein translocase subunit SecG [Nitrosospira sp.]GDX61280.1 preprotein translocase subunit SecG [Nitrosomonadaceae bacterium]MBI0407708.1 preprotein translocase subunit SecG [Nitrosospira sp.]MBI0414543.1 preprotein translocase subunit SecG [Nitrosospira sp.]MBI0417002.1 preprotein translocase subunit SecG [Nitrosospira sp.]